MENIQADYLLEIYSEPCPYPSVKTLEMLKELESGEILEVVTDCAQSINTIPHDASNHGHKVLKIEQLGAIIRFWIQRG